MSAIMVDGKLIRIPDQHHCFQLSKLETLIRYTYELCIQIIYI